jgi:prepilin-type N-terminal cleavage/methylation domain-containing protein
MNTKKNAGFTLVELLVVIAIIGMLAAIIMPSIASAKKKANIAKTKTECLSIRDAIKAYVNTYNHYPLQTTAVDEDLLYEDDYSDLIAILRNDTSNDNTETYNPRGQIFLDVPRKDLNDSDEFVDPWDKAYVVICDANFDTIIDAATGEESGVYEELYGISVAVYSYGPDGSDDKGEQGRKSPDDVNSWD